MTNDRPPTPQELKQEIHLLRYGFARAGDRFQLGIDQALKENRALYQRLQKLEQQIDRQLHEDRVHHRQSIHRIKIYLFGSVLFTIGLSLLENFVLRRSP